MGRRDHVETSRRDRAEIGANSSASPFLSLRPRQETPAARAGFRKFDLIVEIDGKAVKTAADAQSIVDSAKVGQQMQASPNCCEVCAWRSAVCAVFPIALSIS